MMQQEEAQNYNAWLQQKVERLRASAKEGNLIPAAEVEAHFAAHRAATRSCDFAQDDKKKLDGIKVRNKTFLLLLMH